MSATPFLQDADLTLYVGDCADVLATLSDGSVDCVVTSPPYWGLRDYGVDGQLGLEATPDEYVARMVAVFREVRRVLADHGTLWLNLGDSYAGSSGNGGATSKKSTNVGSFHDGGVRMPPGLKPKDLVGIPWRVAFALQADGWYLRSDIIWAKPNPMPESVTDRPTKAHEYVFLLSKGPRYWFDQEAVREKAVEGTDLGLLRGRNAGGETSDTVAWHAKSIRDRQDAGVDSRTANLSGTRNIRSVWEVATQPYAGAHFATYPEELVRRAILAGCPEWVCETCGKPRERIVDVSYGKSPAHGSGSIQGSRGATADGTHLTGGRANKAGVHGQPRVAKITDTLGWSDCGHNNYRPGITLDPFLGSGTTALVARKHGRHAIGIELNEEYARLAAERTKQLSLLGDPV